MTSPMTPHLEKIARAIYEARRAKGRTLKIEHCNTAADTEWTHYMDEARAVLSALLPPSEEMAQAMRSALRAHYPGGGPVLSSGALAKMITAAIQSILTEGEGA